MSGLMFAPVYDQVYAPLMLSETAFYKWPRQELVWIELFMQVYT